MKILLVEDDISISTYIKLELEDHHIEVSAAFDSKSAEKLLHNEVFDVIILDIHIPGINGFQLCRKIRAAHIKTPVIMLTSLDEIEHKLCGFKSGADVYLVKPFSFSELFARIKALHNRTNLNQSVAEWQTFSNLKIDNYSKKVFRGEKEIKVSLNEFLILQLFISNPGRIISHIEIKEKIWGLTAINSNLLEANISSIRSKIDKNFSPKLIHTIPKSGYVMKVEE